jgi:hypothetical protein
MSTVKRIWRLRWAMPPASRATPCSLPVRLMSLTPIFAVRNRLTFLTISFTVFKECGGFV